MASDFVSLSNFFVQQPETSTGPVGVGGLRDVVPEYRPVLVSDGTLTHMLAALFLEDIDTHCEKNEMLMPSHEQRHWLEISEEQCLCRRVTLNGASTGETYVRAFSHLYPPRLPASFITEMSRPGASIGSQLLRSALSHRRELIWIRPGPASSLSRLYRIFVCDRPAILIQEDFLSICSRENTVSDYTKPASRI